MWPKLINIGIDDLAAVLRTILFCVFAVAGVAKLRSLTSFQSTLESFGLPKKLTKPVAITLPLLELATAGMLALSRTVGGGLALILLIVFIGAIGINLAAGRRPDCHCFGQLRSEPISGKNLGTNILLAVSAMVVIWSGMRPSSSVLGSLISRMSGFERVSLTLLIIELLIVVALVVLAWEIIKQQGRLLIRLENLEGGLTNVRMGNRSVSHPRFGLAYGSTVEHFSLKNLLGHTVTLNDLIGQKKNVLLLFSNPNCGPCQQLIPSMKEWIKRLHNTLTIVIVSQGDPIDNRGYPTPNLVLLQRQRELADYFQAWGTPSAVLLDDKGTVISGVAAGAEQIGNLIDTVSRMTTGRENSLSKEVDRLASNLDASENRSV